MDANEHKYYYFNLCLFVFIRGFLYPLSSFLFSISSFNVLVEATGNSSFKKTALIITAHKV
jgi:hypothetical protein